MALVLCMVVNTTCVSPAWISALVNGPGKRRRRWKSLVGASPRRFGGPPSIWHIWIAKKSATRNPLSPDFT